MGNDDTSSIPSLRPVPPQPELTGGRKRRKIFFHLLTLDYPAWSDADPSTCAFVLAGFAVQGVNGCKDPAAWPLAKAKARALEWASSAERAEYLANMSLGIRDRMDAMLMGLVGHVEDVMTLEPPEGADAETIVRLAAVKQQVAQLGWQMVIQFKKSGGKIGDSEQKAIQRLQERTARARSSGFAEKLKAGGEQ